MNRLSTVLTLAATTTLLASTANAQQVSRTEVLDRAKAFVFYPWRASAANQSGSCPASYQPMYVPGDQMGVAYKWGGFKSLFQFSEDIDNGRAAGKAAGGDVLSCTTGVDCSGFVSQIWKRSWKYGTATLHEISSSLPAENMLVGDIFNEAGYHTAMFSHFLDNGEPYMLEAVFNNTHINATGGWTWVDGFIPRRFDNIVGTTASNPVGTLNNPIQVASFPYADSRNTQTSPSDLLDGCGVSPGTNETGHEFIYQIEVAVPGQLTVSVSDDISADIDVHLASSWNTNDCMARHDSAFTQTVDCGTYYVIADTYGGDGNAGNFDLTIDFAANGNACGPGPAGYDFDGALGDACAYPNNPNLPFCNNSLDDSEVCLYTASDSFCSKACESNADCEGMPGGDCCEDIGSGEFYCINDNLCHGTDPEDPEDPENPEDPQDPEDPENPEDPEDPGMGDNPADGESDGGGCQTGGRSGTSTGLGLLLSLLGYGFYRRRKRLPL